MKIGNLGNYSEERIMDSLSTEVADLDHLALVVQQALDNETVDTDRFFNSGGRLGPLENMELSVHRLAMSYVKSGHYGRLVVLVSGLRPLLESDLQANADGQDLTDRPSDTGDYRDRV